MDPGNNIAGDGYRYRVMLQVILSLLLFSCNGDYLEYNKHLTISGWKFTMGDKPEYAPTSYNDSNWSTIDVTTYWESQGYEGYDGYGWYRVKVFIPSSLVRNASMKDSLKLFLEKVDDYDQVYLNGRLLGENNLTIRPLYTLPYRSFVDKPTKYDIPRKYRIPLDDERILWDKENLIAVMTK